jgi:DNA-directed RNA polymerase subunit RPC12/RpoP
MSRLTLYDHLGLPKVRYPYLTEFEFMLKELQHYKDLEEQGRLKIQVHGQWEILTDEYDCEYMLCTACGEEFYPVDEDTVDKTYNYCPNCGAKMNEVEDD